MRRAALITRQPRRWAAAGAGATLIALLALVGIGYRSPPWLRLSRAPGHPRRASVRGRYCSHQLDMFAVL